MKTRDLIFGCVLSGAVFCGKGVGQEGEWTPAALDAATGSANADAPQYAVDHIEGLVAAGDLASLRAAAEWMRRVLYLEPELHEDDPLPAEDLHKRIAQGILAHTHPGAPEPAESNRYSTGQALFLRDGGTDATLEALFTEASLWNRSAMGTLRWAWEIRMENADSWYRSPRILEFFRCEALDYGVPQAQLDLAAWLLEELCTPEDIQAPDINPFVLLEDSGMFPEAWEIAMDHLYSVGDGEGGHRFACLAAAEGSARGHYHLSVHAEESDAQDGDAAFGAHALTAWMLEKKNPAYRLQFGRVLLEGRGMPRDDRMGLSLLAKAAEGEDAEVAIIAAFNLANYYDGDLEFAEEYAFWKAKLERLQE